MNIFARLSGMTVDGPGRGDYIELHIIIKILHFTTFFHFVFFMKHLRDTKGSRTTASARKSAFISESRVRCEDKGEQQKIIGVVVLKGNFLSLDSLRTTISIIERPN